MTLTKRAITDAALRVLHRRASSLRDRAAGHISTTPDKEGRNVPIVVPKARVMLNTAALLEACAADLQPKTERAPTNV